MKNDRDQILTISVDENDDNSVESMGEISKDSTRKGTTHDDFELEVDDRGVTLSRWLVAFVLVSATCSLCLFTYRFVLHNQEEDFENEFKALSNEIIELSQAKVQNLFGVLEGLSVSTTSYALSTNAIWPFVTIPNFEQRSAAAKKSSQALIIAHVPLVEEKDRYMWEQYSIQRQGWIQEAYTDQDDSFTTADEEGTFQPIPEQIWHSGKRRRHLDGAVGCGEEETEDSGSNRELTESKSWVPEDRGSGPYAPVWHLSPPPPMNDTKTINFNLLRKPVFEKAVQFVSHSRRPVFLDVCNQAKWFGISSMGDKLQTVIVQPILEDFTENSKIVGYFVAVVPWESFFNNILHPQAKPITVVLQNTCDEVFTFQVEGYNATLIAEEISYDKNFQYMEVTKPFAKFSNPSEELLEGYEGEGVCVYNISVYPTQPCYDMHVDNDSYLYAGLVVSIFVLTSFVFCVYDLLVQKRQMRLMKNASRLQRSLITSLFPANVRDRVIESARENQNKRKLGKKFKNNTTGQHKKLTNSPSLTSGRGILADEAFASKPIADLFPEVTIMFADIAGFTAWSSARAPEQVFTLLETIYHSFDAFAGKLNVFKVETIGDCYVAATGIPEYDERHATNMAIFARRCLKKFNETVRKLESTLGPETRNLKLRTGLHTGPVTAGVLRGEKARFQLFGDTMNTAARMESTGEPNKIHISREAAELIIQSGRKNWVSPREDIVHAKGKGAMKTFWLNTGKPFSSCHSVDNTVSCADDEIISFYDDDKNESDNFASQPLLSKKMLTLIDWNCALLMPHLREIMMRRKSAKPSISSAEKISSLETHFSAKTMVADEVQDIIELPEYIGCETQKRKGEVDVISEEVRTQLYNYVKILASMYEDNPFHCFEHASHVTMSTSKLLSRIVAPTTTCGNVTRSGRHFSYDEKSLHDHTYGITSDPLTQFAVILAAVMHDADHKGVPNEILIRENPTLSERFQNKSVAEQNSVDLAWNVLMGDEFETLRRCICCNEVEFKRFRQLIVNSVMATDIFDKDLNKMRKARWDKAFSEEEELSKDYHDADTTAAIQTNVNRKATIVIEHLIQASDVAHTMQHWLLYTKWNERLFEETFKAYISGRVAKDPSDSWYDGELWFFDNYIIPLTKKLSICGVFGASSDEYLNYAIANRREWEVKGKEIVVQLKTKYSNV